MAALRNLLHSMSQLTASLRSISAAVAASQRWEGGRAGGWVGGWAGGCAGGRVAASQRGWEAMGM